MDEIKIARLNLKSQMVNDVIWPSLRCACGAYGATDLGHIVYTRHPDSVELYHKYNCVLLHNVCNTTGESLAINVNACLIILQRAEWVASSRGIAGPLRGLAEWQAWAKALPRKGAFWIPEKMQIAMELWIDGVRPFEFYKIRRDLESR